MSLESWREKRRYERFLVDDYSVVAYRAGLLRRILFSKKNIAKVVRNLSEGGACLLLEERLAPGAKVRMLLMFNRFDDVFETEGTVRWVVTSRKRKNVFETGLKFGRMKEIQRHTLKSAMSWFTSDACRMRRETMLRRKAKGNFSIKGSGSS